MRRCMGWEDVINEWFNKGYISSGKILADNQIRVVPGKVENFSFHFSRELIPIEGGINWQVDRDGNHIISFQNWSDLNSYSREAFEAFRKNSKS